MGNLGNFIALSLGTYLTVDFLRIQRRLSINAFRYMRSGLGASFCYLHVLSTEIKLKTLAQPVSALHC